MLRFIVRRVLWMIPTVLFVTFLVYVAASDGIPWRPTDANPRASEEKIAQFREVNGLYEGPTGYIRQATSSGCGASQGPDQWSRSIKGGGEVYPTLRYSLFNTFGWPVFSASSASASGCSSGWSPQTTAHGSTAWSTRRRSSSDPFRPFVSAIVLQLAFAVQLGWLPAAGVYPPARDGFDPG